MADTPGLQEPLPLSSTTFTMMGTVRTSLALWCSPLMDSHTKKTNKTRTKKTKLLHGFSAAWGSWRYTGRYTSMPNDPVAEVVFQSEQSQSRPPLRVDLPTLTMVAVSESASSASSSTSSNDWTLVDIGSRASTSVPTISPSVASSSQTGYFYAAEQHGALTLPTQPPTELWHPSSAQPPPNRELPTPNPPLTQTTHAFHSSGFWV